MNVDVFKSYCAAEAVQQLSSHNLKVKSTGTTTWKNQEGKFTTSNKENVDFCLPEFIATKKVSWKFHVYKQTNSRYDMILGRNLLTALGLDLKFFVNLIIVGEGP